MVKDDRFAPSEPGTTPTGIHESLEVQEGHRPKQLLCTSKGHTYLGRHVELDSDAIKLTVPISTRYL